MEGCDGSGDTSIRLRRPDDVFDTHKPGSYNYDSIMEFFLELHRHLDGDKVTLI